MATTCLYVQYPQGDSNYPRETLEKRETAGDGLHKAVHSSSVSPDLDAIADAIRGLSDADRAALVAKLMG